MDFIYIIAKRIKFVFITTFIFFLSTILSLVIKKPEYYSVSKIMSPHGSSGVSQSLVLASQFGFNIPLQQNAIKWGYKDIIGSRTLARAVLKNKFDSIEFGPQKTLTQILTYGNNKTKLELAIIERIAVDRFLLLVNVSEDIKTGIFTCTINSSEPELANNINIVLLNELENYQRKHENIITSNTREFIEERIIEFEYELSLKEDLLRGFRHRNRNIGNSPSLKLEEERLLRDVGVFTGVYTNLRQQLETAKIEEARDRNYVMVLDIPEVLIVQNSIKNLLTIIFFTLLGLGLSFLLLYSVEYYKAKEEKINKMMRLIKQ